MPYRRYFSVMAFTCGWIFCIFMEDLIPEMRKGNSTSVMTMVRKAMAHPQLGIRCSWVHLRHKNNGREIKPSFPQSRRPRRSGPPGCACVLSRMSTDFGPTNTRSRVRPLTLPTATPSTEALSFGPSSGLSGFLGISTWLCRVTKAVSLGSLGMKAIPKYWSPVAIH